MLFRKKALKGETLLTILRNFSKEISSILHIKELLKSFLKTLIEVGEVRNGSLWLMDFESSVLELRESLGGDPLVLQYSSSDSFVNFLRQTQKVLTKHQLLQNPIHIDIKETGLKFMTSGNAETVFPLLVEKKFIGVLALGPWLDGGRTLPERQDFLEVLISMGAISIDNALLYDSLAKQNLKLSEMAKLKTQFVSTITHELSTPLNGIKGLTDVLLDSETGGELNDDQKRYLQMIRSASEELSEVVQQIIDLTRFQSKQRALEVKQIDFRKTVLGLEKEFEGLLSQKEISLQVAMEQKVKVYGDEGQIRQVVQSLMENAVKFMDSSVSPKVIGIQASRHGDMIKVCVSDQGIGIKEEDQEVIFDEFRQADGDLTRSYGGTGLGLALAKKIVELHGGRIWVESKRGEGSQFYFTLPLKPGLVQAEELNTGRH